MNKSLFSSFNKTEQQDVSGKIRQIYIELSTYCNLDCKTCVRNSIENFKPSHFPLPLLRKVVNQLQSTERPERVVLLGYGESLMNPGFNDLLSEIKKISSNIVLVTNAHLLTTERSDFLLNLPIREIYFSWDDTFGDSAQAIRKGSNRDLFLDNVNGFIEKNKVHKAIKTGLEIVATKQNINEISKLIDFFLDMGIEKIIITNLFPYTSTMKDEILYSVNNKPEKVLKKLLSQKRYKDKVQFPDFDGNTDRKCEFLEKGTVFISSKGEISPCPELAYPHDAWYFGNRRKHNRQSFGNIKKDRLTDIWNSEEFKVFRDSFLYYDFSDCSTCYNPDNCWHRTVKEKDCFDNSTPCGECLWAKGIVVCP